MFSLPLLLCRWPGRVAAAATQHIRARLSTPRELLHMGTSRRDGPPGAEAARSGRSGSGSRRPLRARAAMQRRRQHPASPISPVEASSSGDPSEASGTARAATITAASACGCHQQRNLHKRAAWITTCDVSR